AMVFSALPLRLCVSAVTSSPLSMAQLIIRERTMAELEIHHEGHESDPMGKTVGVIAAVLAVFLAIVTIASHRTHTAAIMHKSSSNDQWAYYQATRVKLHSTELGQNLVSTFGGKNAAAEKMIHDYEGQKKKYEEQS